MLNDSDLMNSAQSKKGYIQKEDKKLYFLSVAKPTRTGFKQKW